MYSVKPIGLNTKDNDRDVPDGSLLESINMQWRDGAFKPIPERLVTEIIAGEYVNIILHKVGDENTINVLGFNRGEASETFLAYDLAEYLGGTATGGNVLEWFGTITDGVYSPRTVIQLPFVRTTGMSFTILNGLIYFMGDGTTEDERYYVRLQYNESDNTYITKDMYAWKTLIPYLPVQGNITLSSENSTYNLLTVCGIISIRFALVLKSGEVVLHSPVYGYRVYAINRSDTGISRDDLLTNIHTFINLDLDFADDALFGEEISSINVYASTPYYITKVLADAASGYHAQDYDTFGLFLDPSKMVGQFKRQAEDVFYLLHSTDRPTATKLLLTVGDFEGDITYSGEYTKLDMSTIAAGEIMPVDNFSYHSVYGKIGSYNGRLDIIRPSTVLSVGHIRSLAMNNLITCDGGFKIETEDGNLNGVAYPVDVALLFDDAGIILKLKSRGILSYPDYRATFAGGSEAHTGALRLFKTRKNNSHNLACAFNSMGAYWPANTFEEDAGDATKINMEIDYDVIVKYYGYDELTAVSQPFNVVYYRSSNRLQFSGAGEFSVWPALNSHRLGEGRIMSLGTGSVNPSESQIISPLIIGTSDGVYTANLDPSGSVFIASITKTKHIPFISEEILEIDMNILFVSDQGLMVFSDGDVQNLTKDFLPPQGSGGYPVAETIFIGYDLLTSDFFGVSGNPYQLDDVVTYLKAAILAFDARRNNIWCSNPSYNFSLVYNLNTKQWGMSTIVFTEKQELFSTINTAEGEVYSRYLIKTETNPNLLILSGEDLSTEVFYHVMTRPIKFQNTDDYKVLPRMISRTLLIRNDADSYVSIGLWGQQEVNRYKKSIPLALKKDDRADSFPNNIRYHLPVDCRKGKYKTITVLQAGKALPESYISSFDFDIYMIDNNRMR